MRIATCLGAVVFALGLGVAAAPADDAKPDPKFSDAAFVNKVASCGAHEVQLGQLVKTNAASSQVKKFGERMVTDHTALSDQLKVAAKDANLPLPGKLGDEEQKHIDQLSKLKGAEFDRAYMDHMVADHKAGVALFEQASKQANDGGIRAFAAKALPTLREHLEQASKIKAALGNGQ